MNKKSILALLIAVMIPVFCYLVLKSFSDGAVDIPRKYLLDSTVQRIENGKQMTDSIWHTTSNIKLVNQMGDSVNLYDIQGKAIVLDFFFTSCGSICPRLTKNMSKLQQSFLKGGNTRQKIDTSVVQFLSFTVDPETDSVKVLKDYADRFGVKSDNWWLLTGNKDSIYRFAFEELKVDKFSTEPITPDFVHTSRFVLLDRNYVVRGFYNGLDEDSTSLKKLARDIGLLMLEKDKAPKRTVFNDIIDLSWLWLIIAVLIAGFILFIM